MVIGVPGARLHHTGVLVADLEAATRHFADAFGYIVETGVIDDAVQTASAQFLRLPGDSVWLELITPLGTPSKLDAALRRGGGIHHLCFQVPEIHAGIARLRQQRMLQVSEVAPGAGFGGRPIAWMMSPQGLLVELLEAGPGPRCLQ